MTHGFTPQKRISIHEEFECFSPSANVGSSCRVKDLTSCSVQSMGIDCVMQVLVGNAKVLGLLIFL